VLRVQPTQFQVNARVGRFSIKCRPNFISFGRNDLQTDRAEKLDKVCHNEIMGTEE
jgi:hypothetical protein